MNSYKIVFITARDGREISPFKSALPWPVAFRALLRHRNKLKATGIIPTIKPA